MGLVKCLFFVSPLLTQASGLYSDVPSSPSGGTRDSPRHARGSGGETSNAETTGLWATDREGSWACTLGRPRPLPPPALRGSDDALYRKRKGNVGTAGQFTQRHRARCDTPYIAFVQPDTADPGMPFPVTGVQICTRRRSPKRVREDRVSLLPWCTGLLEVGRAVSLNSATKYMQNLFSQECLTRYLLSLDV